MVRSRRAAITHIQGAGEPAGRRHSRFRAVLENVLRSKVRALVIRRRDRMYDERLTRLIEGVEVGERRMHPEQAIELERGAGSVRGRNSNLTAVHRIPRIAISGERRQTVQSTTHDDYDQTLAAGSS